MCQLGTSVFRRPTDIGEKKLIKTTHKHMTHSTSTPTLAQQVANAVMTPQGADVNMCTSYIILGMYVCTYMCGCSHCAGRWGNHQPFLPLFGVFTRTPTYPTELIHGTPTNGTDDRHYVCTSVTQMSSSSHVHIHTHATLQCQSHSSTVHLCTPPCSRSLRCLVTRCHGNQVVKEVAHH